MSTYMAVILVLHANLLIVTGGLQKVLQLMSEGESLSINKIKPKFVLMRK